MYKDEINYISKNIFTHVTRDELTILANLAFGKQNCCEIGSYLGASARAICSSFEKDERLFCIDIWKSNTKLRPDPEGLSLLEAFLKNTQKYKEHIIILEEYSQDAITFFLDHEIKLDFLFIDGDHTEEGVKQDFDLYYPILNPGAVIVFHDYAWSSVQNIIHTYVLDKTTQHNNTKNLFWAVKK